MLDVPAKIDAAEIKRRREAFDDAAHSLKMEGRNLDIDNVPEFRAVINGTMTFEEATKSLVAKAQQEPSLIAHHSRGRRRDR